MALFPETREYYDVYEYVPSVGWESPTWNYVGEVFMRVEPVTSSDELVNNQDNQNITEVGFMDIEYDGIVNPDNYLVRRSNGVVYQNKGIPEVWEHLIPYVMCKLERPQSPVTIPSEST